MTFMFRAAAVTALLLASSAAAHLPERVPDEIGQLPPGGWVLEPLAGRTCAGDYCEAGSYQPPFKLYVRETRTEKWGNQTTFLLMADGCAASTDSWTTTTGLSVAERVALVQKRFDAAAASLTEWCNLTGAPSVDAAGSAALFERFDR